MYFLHSLFIVVVEFVSLPFVLFKILVQIYKIVSCA
jgi:hypothetical protein